MESLRRRNLFWGLILVVLGLGFLAQSFDLADFGTIISRFWPIVLIFIGLTDLAAQKYRSAIFWLVIGGLFQLNALDIINVSFWSLFWPVILILIGASILMKQEDGAIKDSKDNISSISVFGGDDRKAESKTFKGADMTAIFGGSKLDLRNTELSKDGAVIDVFILFGGGEILLPKNSNVRLDVLALFGGTDDKRTQHETDDNAPKIRIRGTVLFGGLEIKD